VRCALRKAATLLAANRAEKEECVVAHGCTELLRAVCDEARF